MVPGEQRRICSVEYRRQAVHFQDAGNEAARIRFQILQFAASEKAHARFPGVGSASWQAALGFPGLGALLGETR